MHTQPSCCRHVATGMIIFWTLLCAGVTTLWCMWFDFQIFATNEYEDVMKKFTDECNSHSNIPLTSRINYNYTQERVLSRNGTFDSNYHRPRGDLDSFGDDVSVSDRFLLAVFLSYFLGVAFWHPLIVALKSMYKLKKIHDKPKILREALLFYDSKNLVDLHEIESAVATPRKTSIDSQPDETKSTETQSLHQMVMSRSMSIEMTYDVDGVRVP